MNKGDTVLLILDFTLDGEPLSDDYDELELQLGLQENFNSIKLKKSTGGLIYEDGQWIARLSQADTFRLPQEVEYQLRILTEGEVVSSNVGTFNLGKRLSKEILHE